MKLLIPYALSIALVLSWAPTARSSDMIQECDGLLIQMDDPSELAYGTRLAQASCAHLRRLEKLYRTRLSRQVIRVMADQQSFEKLSGRRWFIVAVATPGALITQPARNLRRLENPAAALAHELVHRFNLQQAGRSCPRWLDEGLAQELSGQSGSGQKVSGLEELNDLEKNLGSPDRDRASREKDYARARWLIRRLRSEVGTQKLLRLLPPLKEGKRILAQTIEGKTVEKLLFQPG